MDGNRSCRIDRCSVVVVRILLLIVNVGVNGATKLRRTQNSGNTEQLVTPPVITLKIMLILKSA